MRLFKVRCVDHLAVELEGACLWLGGEGVDDLVCMLDLRGRRCEGGVDESGEEFEK